MNYLAYGSNLHPLRLSRRLGAVQLLGPVRLPGYQVRFNKVGQDGSGKCNLVKSSQPEHFAYGAVYRIERHHKEQLDRFEGKGDGYMDAEIVIEVDRQPINCITYFAQSSHIDDHTQPYPWYKQLVTQGARFLDFPPPYIQTLDSVSTMPDADSARNQRMQQLLDDIQQYPTGVSGHQTSHINKERQS